MKLGEALFRLDQIEERLNEIEVLLTGGPRERVMHLIDECNTLLNERFVLQGKADQAVRDNNFEGTSIYEVQFLVRTLNIKISVLRLLKKRTDLDTKQLESISAQIDDFSRSKINIERSLNNRIWEIELDQ